MTEQIIAKKWAVSEKGGRLSPCPAILVTSDREPFLSKSQA